jgi:hypothetical protein
MEMISAFTDVLHVPNLTTDAQMMNVLKQSDAFSRDDLAKLASKLKGRKASIGGNFFSERNSSAKIFYIYFWGDFFFILYSALLRLPSLRFHCADGCWDRTQDRCKLQLVHW